MELLSNEECNLILRKRLRDPDAELQHFSIHDFPSSSRGFLGVPGELRIETSEEKFSFFIKYTPKSNQSQGEIVKVLRVFYKEGCLYEGILEELRCYIEGSIYPEFYFSRCDDIIVLENMAEKEFVTKPTDCILDEDHCLLGVKTLAKLHAASIIYEEKNKVRIGEKYQNVLFETMYLKNPEFPNHTFLRVGMRAIMCLIKKYFPHLTPTVLEKISGNLHAMLLGLPPSPRIRNVFTHGDMWANNVLYHYTNNKVDDIRLVDFQLSRYGTPTFDVCFFLYLSTAGSFRKEKLSLLLMTYYNHLKEILSRENLKIEEILPLNLFKNEIEQEKVMILCCTIIHLHYVLIPQKDLREFMDKAEEYEKIVMVSRDNLVLKVSENDKNYRERILDILSELVDAVEMKYGNA